MDGSATSKIKVHIERFFSEHKVTYEKWNAGPMVGAVPHFEVACVAPGPKSSLWTYVSVGGCDVHPDVPNGLEFFISVPSAHRRYVGFMTMAAYYHKNHHLGVGHTYPIGEPWDDDST